MIVTGKRWLWAGWRAKGGEVGHFYAFVLVGWEISNNLRSSACTPWANLSLKTLSYNDKNRYWRPLRVPNMSAEVSNNAEAQKLCGCRSTASHARCVSSVIPRFMGTLKKFDPPWNWCIYSSGSVFRMELVIVIGYDDRKLLEKNEII